MGVAGTPPAIQYGGISLELMAKCFAMLNDYRNEISKETVGEVKRALDPDGNINATFKENIEWLKVNGFCDDNLKGSKIISAFRN